jgi:hypothetical protein
MRTERLDRLCLLSVPLVLAACASPTAAITLECPPTLRVRQAVVSPPPSWRGVPSEVDHRLVSAGFSDGPAEERAFLKPATSTTARAIRTVTWRFESGGSDRVWLSCSYEATSASVTKLVEGRVSQCVVTYDEKSDRSEMLRQISCQ